MPWHTQFLLTRNCQAAWEIAFARCQVHSRGGCICKMHFQNAFAKSASIMLKNTCGRGGGGEAVNCMFVPTMQLMYRFLQHQIQARKDVRGHSDNFTNNQLLFWTLSAPPPSQSRNIRLHFHRQSWEAVDVNKVWKHVHKKPPSQVSSNSVVIRDCQNVYLWGLYTS